MNAKIGIRPIIDGRKAERENLEEKVMSMAVAAKELIEGNLKYLDGTPVQCVIADTTISGSAQARDCAEKFSKENVTATLSVTSCWCYGSETMDTDPNTIKAIWGFNGTENPGAVYLAAAMAAHAQKGYPAFSIYGKDVQDKSDTSIPEDVQEKILQFARCAVAVGTMKGKSYVNVGSVSMGIQGSYCDDQFFQKYLGIRPEFVDMTEVLRRMKNEIYDEEEYKRAYEWTRKNCKDGFDNNKPEIQHTAEQKEEEWKFVVKMTMIIRDIMLGNPRLKELGYYEESLGRNAIAGGFQGQRMWSDWQPVGDFAEAILNSSFDWNGVRKPTILATENDTLNATSMLFGQLLTNSASVFADVRTYWSPEAVERVSGWKPEGLAENGFIHLINSGAAALDGSARSKDSEGKPCMKPWYEMKEEDVTACLEATQWCPASAGYFQGGGFSSQFYTKAEMPVTLMRVNLVHGVGPTLQIAEGYTVVLPEEVHDILNQRTDPTWPTTWFAPRLTGEGAFSDVYSVMANWGANHGSFSYGHIGKELITLASMLRIPVSLHNVERKDIFRPHCFAGFGTADLESADYRACQAYGPLYR
ncbi:L-fucose isomerase [Massiliimalia timonensis]|uniref:L-fucose isomerase n=1 Tax=Massiliimalia timonensis TaxID=1987501 RepID=A0A8J6PI42_9FIRM|nr:L-fucose isomerase [Massiliimalia timonensis]MBC8610490.1 L-fucose isomerase [Massiliimalia timonensis]